MIKRFLLIIDSLRAAIEDGHSDIVVNSLLSFKKQVTHFCGTLDKFNNVNLCLQKPNRTLLDCRFALDRLTKSVTKGKEKQGRYISGNANILSDKLFE